MPRGAHVSVQAEFTSCTQEVAPIDLQSNVTQPRMGCSRTILMMTSHDYRVMSVLGLQHHPNLTVYCVHSDMQPRLGCGVC